MGLVLYIVLIPTNPEDNTLIGIDYARFKGKQPRTVQRVLEYLSSLTAFNNILSSLGLHTHPAQKYYCRMLLKVHNLNSFLL